MYLNTPSCSSIKELLNAHFSQSQLELWAIKDTIKYQNWLLECDLELCLHGNVGCLALLELFPQSHHIVLLLVYTLLKQLEGRLFVCGCGVSVRVGVE